MDYKEKYERLTQFIKDLYPHMSDYCKEKTEGMIPELKESEDEKIRKEIIQSIQDNMCVIHKDKCIAWLEKQGEQKSTWSEEDEKMLKSVISSIRISRSSCEEDDDVRDLFDNEIDWLESLKERMKGE